MSDDFQDDIHDKLVQAFIEYSRWNSRFELFGYKESAVKARSALTDIGHLAKQRRQEIWEKRIALHGHKRKGIPPSEPKKQRKR